MQAKLWVVFLPVLLRYSISNASVTMISWPPIFFVKVDTSLVAPGLWFWEPVDLLGQTPENQFFWPLKDRSGLLYLDHQGVKDVYLASLPLTTCSMMVYKAAVNFYR